MQAAVSAATRRLAGRGLRSVGLRSERTARRFVGEASRWAPDYVAPSAWLEHAPFAFWLVGALRPTAVVELGTHAGFSYLVLCQAIRDHGLGARAWAIDTWVGDEHAGYYGDDVLTELRGRHDNEYGGFSTLVRSTFADAAASFGDGSVDLLHIDGLHTYEAVRGDFETWEPKLSDRALVLFHDTNAHFPGFGVHRFWAEIGSRYPSFEFLHGNGLGLLVVGAETPSRVRELTALSDRPRATNAVRRRYEALGSATSRSAAARRFA